MLVNRGGEPEAGRLCLPPVDIEIPDDAKELERDIQAYRRELHGIDGTGWPGGWAAR